MKTLLILCCTLFTLSLSAQQTDSIVNDPNAKTRSLNGSFTAITVTDGIALYLTSGTEESVAVSFSDAKYEERFKTEVKDGVLKIYYDNNGINWSDNNKRKLKAYVSFKTLEKLSAAGGALVKLPVAVTVDKLEMKFTSGSLFEGSISGKEITVEQNSGSAIDLSGNAAKIKVEVSSGAMFKGYGFTASYCEAKASSGGGIRLTVEKELSASANSGGGIHYKGAAVIRDINIHSGGTVKKA